MPKAAEKMKEIERVFQSANLIAECVSNWKDGLISQDFVWYLKGTDGQRIDTKAGGNESAAQAEIQLQRWLDWVEQQAIAADPETTNFKQADPWSEFVLSLGVTGEGNLRLWQPRRYENDPDPIHRIHLHAPKTGSVATERDDDGFVKSIAYTYGDNKKEVQTLNEQGNVVVQTSGKTSEPEGEALELDTAGRWTVQQVRSPSLLTKPIKQKQNAINHALTMKLRNQELSGFRERTFLNAQSPGEWVDDPKEPGGQRFEPSTEPMERGPGYDNYVYGVPTGDAANPGYTNPQVHESQPIPVTTFKEGIEVDRVLMYLEFKQGHLLSQGDGGLSGESRIQMRQGFELYLRGFKRRIESAIANILNIVLKILEYEGFEVVVELQITTGKLSSEERQIIISEHQAGLLSTPTAIARLGTADPDAEMALIEEEQQRQMQRRSPITDPFETDEDEDEDGN
ncbi:MAG: hypothetical protein SFY66_19735 [Oculatellaceae cyanobacterium bins.114]|nr:hypothetical protein [Oculatellaceae cyanobacterium bins.114]